jgi:thymidylate kinase
LKKGIYVIQRIYRKNQVGVVVMAIICLEGASAIGKTTTCREIEKRYNAYVVPEVNLLFQRPNPEPQKWYIERQVERWQIANEKLKSYDLVLLDGDVFQPIWYNWIYNEYHNSLLFLKEFYATQIKAQNVGFPDVYIHLSTNEKELRKRKENDTTRRRGNFEKHLSLTEPQKRYFQIMNNICPDLVHFIDAVSIEKNVKGIIDVLFSLTNSKSNRYSISLFNDLMDWLMKNNPSAC